MARPPKWNPEQKANALQLYVGFGVTEASRRSGIPARTIQGWAKAAGTSLPQPRPIQEAAQKLASEVVSARTGETATHAEVTDAALTLQAKRELLVAMNEMAALEHAGDMLRRMDEKHEDFIGYKDGVERVEYQRAPANAVLAYARSFEILMRRAAPKPDDATTQVQARIIDMVDERDRPVVQQVLDMALEIRRQRREHQLGSGDQK